jgi:hypothetical protein
MLAFRPKLHWLVATLLLSQLLGCAGSAHPNESPKSDLMPIDRVRNGIIALQANLKLTIASAQSLAGGPSARSVFSQNLRATEEQIGTLRADAIELRDRASDYLALWSGQTMTITGQSHSHGTDEQRDRAKAKYDAFVGDMVAARDIVLPLLDRLRTIDSSADQVALQAELRQAQVDGAKGIQHLDEALAALDELRNMLQAKGN